MSWREGELRLNNLTEPAGVKIKSLVLARPNYRKLVKFSCVMCEDECKISEFNILRTILKTSGFRGILCSRW